MNAVIIAVLLLLVLVQLYTVIVGQHNTEWCVAKTDGILPQQGVVQRIVDAVEVAVHRAIRAKAYVVIHTPAKGVQVCALSIVAGVVQLFYMPSLLYGQWVVAGLRRGLGMAGYHITATDRNCGHQ